MFVSRGFQIGLGAALVALFAVSAPVLAGDQNGKTEKEICYPEILTEADKLAGEIVPCAPPNYVVVPHRPANRHQFHDESRIWTDEEVKLSEIHPGRGASIWRSSVTIGNVEVMVSAITAGLCETPSRCPVRVRLREPGKPDRIVDVGQMCTEGFYLIRDDVKDLHKCDKHYPLDSGKN